MGRILSLLLYGPILPLAAGTIGLTLYWVLRFLVKQTGSYRTLAAEMGEPGPVEHFFVGSMVVVLYGLLAYRGIALLVGGFSR